VSIILERIPELHVNGEGRINLKKRSVRLKAFCKKAASEAYAIPGFPLWGMDSMKSGDNSDRKMNLHSEWSRVMLIYSFVVIDTDKKGEKHR